MGGLLVLSNDSPHTAPRNSRIQFSSLETPCVNPTLDSELPRSLIITILRLTPLLRLRARRRPQTFSVVMPSCSNNSGSVTRPLLSPRLVPWVSCTTTFQTLRLVSFLLPNVRPPAAHSAILIGFAIISFRRDRVLSVP